jgi:3-isopropylmalate/(R)-2-methylmalate dehydratase small subunit
MHPFTTHTGTAAPLPMLNVDTDQIIPKQFLKTIKRSGLGTSLFFDLRYHDSGAENPGFVLNKPAYRTASILIVHDNFGCGSSREHAPWALLDFGIRVIIAPSFADIFYNNCFKNGILPIRLPRSDIDRLMAIADAGGGQPFTVDLAAETLTIPGGEVLHFDIDPFRKHCLLHGLDDVGLTLQKTERISAFEQQQQAQQPWLRRA